MHSFGNFLADLGKAPSKAHSLERDRVDGNYEPSNCRWATEVEQARNKTNTIYVEYNSIKKPLSQWADDLGIKYKKLYRELRERGKSISEFIK